MCRWLLLIIWMYMYQWLVIVRVIMWCILLTLVNVLNRILWWQYTFKPFYLSTPLNLLFIVIIPKLIIIISKLIHYLEPPWTFHLPIRLTTLPYLPLRTYPILWLLIAYLLLHFSHLLTYLYQILIQLPSHSISPIYTLDCYHCIQYPLCSLYEALLSSLYFLIW